MLAPAYLMTKNHVRRSQESRDDRSEMARGIGVENCYNSLLILNLVNVRHLDIASLLIAVFPVKSCLPILVHLQLGNSQTARRDPNLNGGPVRLLARNPLDVDDELLAEAGRDLPLARLVHSPRDDDLVVLADGHGADAVAGLELLREVSRHECSAGLRVGCEVSLARLASRGGNGRRVLHIVRSNDGRERAWKPD